MWETHGLRVEEIIGTHGKQKILDELRDFITLMGNHEWVISTLDDMQSVHWDEEGEIDYWINVQDSKVLEELGLETREFIAKDVFNLSIEFVISSNIFSSSSVKSFSPELIITMPSFLIPE